MSSNEFDSVPDYERSAGNDRRFSKGTVIGLTAGLVLALGGVLDRFSRVGETHRSLAF